MAAAYEVLNGFAPTFEAAHLAGLRRKLGLFTQQANDLELATDLLERMAANHADFTLTFRSLADAAEQERNEPLHRLSDHAAVFDEWAARWRNRLAMETVSKQERAASMRAASPVYIPRNHLVQEVIDAAVLRNHFEPFETLLQVTGNAYEEQPGRAYYAQPSHPEQRITQTFCGT